MRVHSQSNQDGVLEWIFLNIEPTNKQFVEFGFNSPTYEEASIGLKYENPFSGANTQYLYSKGWRGLLLDSSYQNPEINLQKEWLTPQNILPIFEKYGVPREVDYVSIDVDSSDLWLFEAIVSKPDLYRPRVITVEYNCVFPPNFPLACERACKWRGDRIYGAGLAALRLVGSENGYTLVDVVEMLDAVFVRSDLIGGGVHPQKEERWGELSSCVIHRPVEDMQRLYEELLDYETYRKALAMGASEDEAMAIAVSNAKEWIDLEGGPILWKLLSETSDEIRRELGENNLQPEL